MDKPSWVIRGGRLNVSKPLVMGVLNVTPDSFSDGGRFETAESVFEAAQKMVREGADILDLGGESTRPGAEAVSAEEELSRLLPVLKKIRKGLQVALSIDTTKADVARACLDEGAHIINDVSGLAVSGESLAHLVRDSGAGLVLMHRRGNPQTMQQLASYGDVTGEVCAELAKGLAFAQACGIDAEQIVVDPGLGFAKTGEQNFLLLRELQRLSALGRPVLIGPSRKSFIGKVTGRQPGSRDYGTAAAVACAYAQGARIFRVHKVAAIRDVLKVCEAIYVIPAKAGIP